MPIKYAKFSHFYYFWLIFKSDYIKKVLVKNLEYKSECFQLKKK